VVSLVIGAALFNTQGAGATLGPELVKLPRIRSAVYLAAARPRGRSRLEQLAPPKDGTLPAVPASRPTGTAPYSIPAPVDRAGMYSLPSALFHGMAVPNAWVNDFRYCQQPMRLTIRQAWFHSNSR
jgi:hypothetical protein